jgi:hypothetical protein
VGLINLCKHLVESTAAEFLLLGVFSNDILERQFGKFRQGAGGAYLITARAVIEKNRINRAKLLLERTDSLTLLTGSAEEHSCNVCESFDAGVLDECCSLVEGLYDDTKEALIYVAGYLAFQHGNVDDSTDEYAAHCEFFRQMNRGGLTVPCDSIVHLVYNTYVIFLYVFREQVPCPHLVLNCNLAVATLLSLPFDRTFAMCKTLCNIFVNNYSSLVRGSSGKESVIKLAKFSS